MVSPYGGLLSLFPSILNSLSAHNEILIIDIKNEHLIERNKFHLIELTFQRGNFFLQRSLSALEKETKIMRKIAKKRDLS